MATKFDIDLQFLMQCLREVLEELGHKDLLPFVPWLDDKQPLPKPGAPMPAPQRLVQLLSISFQLLNMIEENTAVQRRRAQQAAHGLESEAGLWPSALASLKAEGFSESQVQSVIRSVRVEPVLTAHPTEAKRASVLEHHRALDVVTTQQSPTAFAVCDGTFGGGDHRAPAHQPALARHGHRLARATRFRAAVRQEPG